jgi:hypothetical protein
MIFRSRLHNPAAVSKPTVGHRVASRGQASTAGAPRVLRAGRTYLEVQLRATLYALRRKREGR